MLNNSRPLISSTYKIQPIRLQDDIYKIIEANQAIETSAKQHFFYGFLVLITQNSIFFISQNDGKAQKYIFFIPLQFKGCRHFQIESQAQHASHFKPYSSTHSILQNNRNEPGRPHQILHSVSDNSQKWQTTTVDLLEFTSDNLKMAKPLRRWGRHTEKKGWFTHAQ